MAIQPDPSPYGSQTVTGRGWPNVDEEMLAATAATYEALAAKITGSIVPQQQGQLMKLADVWEGAGAVAATGEASTIIGGHEANAGHAAAIAGKLRAMEATVVKAKMLANTIAQEVQHECEAIAAMPFSNAQELVQSRIKMGLSYSPTIVGRYALAEAFSASNASALRPTVDTFWPHFARPRPGRTRTDRRTRPASSPRWHAPASAA